MREVPSLIPVTLSITHKHTPHTDSHTRTHMDRQTHSHARTDPHNVWSTVTCQLTQYAHSNIYLHSLNPAPLCFNHFSFFPRLLSATSNDSSLTAMDLGTSRPEAQSRTEGKLPENEKKKRSWFSTWKCLLHFHTSS